MTTYNETNHTCVMADAVSKANKDIAQNVLIVTGGVVLAVFTGGASVIVVSGALADLALEGAQAINHNMDESQVVRRLADFKKDAAKCNDANCAYNAVKDNFARMNAVMWKTNSNDKKQYEDTMKKLAVMIGDEKQFIQATEESNLTFGDKFGQYAESIITYSQIVIGVGSAGIEIAARAGKLGQFGQTMSKTLIPNPFVKKAKEVTSLARVTDNADDGAHAFANAANATENLDDGARIFNNVEDAGRAFANGSDDVVEFARQNVNANEMRDLMRRANAAGYKCTDCGGDVIKFTKEVPAASAAPASSIVNSADDVADPMMATDKTVRSNAAIAKGKAADPVKSIGKVADESNDVLRAGANNADDIVSPVSNSKIAYHGTDADIPSTSKLIPSDGATGVGVYGTFDMKVADDYGIERLIRRQNPDNMFLKTPNNKIISESPLNMTNKEYYIYQFKTSPNAKQNFGGVRSDMNDIINPQATDIAAKELRYFDGSKYEMILMPPEFKELKPHLTKFRLEQAMFDYGNGNPATLQQELEYFRNINKIAGKALTTRDELLASARKQAPLADDLEKYTDEELAEIAGAKYSTFNEKMLKEVGGPFKNLEKKLDEAKALGNDELEASKSERVTVARILSGSGYGATKNILIKNAENQWNEYLRIFLSNDDLVKNMNKFSKLSPQDRIKMLQKISNAFSETYGFGRKVKVRIDASMPAGLEAEYLDGVIRLRPSSLNKSFDNTMKMFAHEMNHAVDDLNPNRGALGSQAAHYANKGYVTGDEVNKIALKTGEDPDDLYKLINIGEEASFEVEIFRINGLRFSDAVRQALGGN